MKKVYIYHDPFDTTKNTVAEVDSVLEYLKKEFKHFPQNGRIYHKAWHIDNDITEKLQNNENYADGLDGDIIVVICPSEPITILTWIFYAIVAVTAAATIYMYMTMPKPTTSAAQSANNDLASRQNQARLGGRVPEILGMLRSTPDLISAPTTYFDEFNREIEECLMLIGRGYYQIHDCKEDQTNATDISGISVSVYDPNTNIKETPIFQIGEAFTEAPLMTVKSKSINGQTLNVPNDQKIESAEIYFQYPNLIKTNSSYINLDSLFDVNDSIAIYGAEFLIDDANISGNATLTTDKKIIIESVDDIISVNNYFKIILTGALIKVTTTIAPIPPETEPTYVDNYYDLSGTYSVSGTNKVAVSGGYRYTINLSNALERNPNWQYLTSNQTVGSNITFTDNSGSINLNGSYLVETVGINEIKLIDPDLLNSDWIKLDALPSKNTQTQPLIVRLDKLNNSWVGWYNIDLDNTEELILNFFFQNGLFYTDSKGGVWTDSMTAILQYQYINDNNAPIGTIYQEYFTISNNSKSPFGTTRRVSLPVKGKIRFRLARTTPTKNDKTQDLTKIRDVYAASKSNVLNYGDVTVVRSKTLGTEGALSLKERKLNLLVTRKLPLNGTGVLTATRSAAQALIYLALDDKNGRRTLSEVDITQILAEEQALINYFGSSKAAEFSYTFDDNNLSFEEIAGMICSTVFCEAYRYGSKLRMRFEADQLNSVLLFNHRNKVPNSETRTKSFTSREGFYSDGYDGIDVEYTSPDDDARINYVASDSMNPTNTMKIKTSGIRTHEQAKTRAWREWNKLKFRNISVEFEALDESNLLARMDRILVADNTLIKTTDGEVEAIDGLILELSQPIEQAGDYSIYLQLPDATVDTIPCSYVDQYRVQLTRMPLVNLAIGRAFYKLILSGSPAPMPFLMTELKPQSKMTNMLTCVNYDSRYYQNDLDFF